jgi:hypothetical protein
MVELIVGKPCFVLTSEYSAGIREHPERIWCYGRFANGYPSVATHDWTGYQGWMMPALTAEQFVDRMDRGGQLPGKSHG